MKSEPRGISARYDRLDALRGVAIVWMACFHFSFDLNYFHFITQNFYRDPFWTVQRAMIVTLFMFCAGVGQAVASQQQQSWPRFWRRWAQIAGCSLLVSLGSWLMFPHSFISFGVLHGMAVMLIVTRLAAHSASPSVSGGTPARWALLCMLGLACVLLPHYVHDAFFDTRLTNWVGLITHKPVTEDYAPVLPWLGVMLWGLVAGQWVLARHPRALAGPLPRLFRPLAALGRWSLSFYMVHQPVLIGLLMALVFVAR